MRLKPPAQFQLGIVQCEPMSIFLNHLWTRWNVVRLKAILTDIIRVINIIKVIDVHQEDLHKKGSRSVGVLHL